MNPTAPSAVVADGSQGVESGGGVSTATKGKPSNPGNGNGNGNGKGDDKGDDKGGGNGNNGPGNGQPTSPTQPPATTGKVEIEGLISAKSGDSITVNAQSITVPLDCVIRHGNTRFTFADLHVGDRVHVKGMRTTAGSGATMTTKIEASEVKLQNPEGNDDNDDGDEGPTNLVSVTAFDPVAIEAGANTGTFRLTRSGTAALLANPLTVTFTLTGTAGNGTDYQSLPLTATFVAGVASTDVVVSPIADGVPESAETVILTLTTVAPYEAGSPAAATLTISDTDSPLVSVSAFDGTASEAGPNLGTLRFTRTGSTAASLAVTFTITGSADNGVDYQTLPTTVTFLTGQATVDLAVFPLADGVAEGIETVTVTITDGAAYDVGTQAAATVNIAG